MRMIVSVSFVSLIVLLMLGAPAQAQTSSNEGFSGLEKHLIKQFFESATAEGVAKATDDDETKKDKKDKKDKKKNKDKKAKKDKKSKAADGSGKSDELPPGLAKKEELPPGLEMQLEKGGTLPPGLATRRLPSKLEAKLPPTAPGRERIIVGDDVVLVETITGRIIDIFANVLLNSGDR